MKAKIHYVTPKVFAQPEPLPTYCGTRQAKRVTVEKRTVTCALCKKKLKAGVAEEEE